MLRGGSQVDLGISGREDDEGPHQTVGAFVVLDSERGVAVLVAEQGAQAAGRPVVLALVGGSRGVLVRGELVELALEVVLEPGPVLALVGPQVLDLALELVALPLDGGDGLLAALVGLLVELLRADAGVGLEAVGLAAGSGSGSGSGSGVGAGAGSALTAGIRPVGSPVEAAATLARSSSFSTVSRSSSASTSSRNWSTSPMS